MTHAAVLTNHLGASCDIWDPSQIEMLTDSWRKMLGSHFSKFMLSAPRALFLQCRFVINEAGLIHAVISTAIDRDYCSEADLQNIAKQLAAIPEAAGMQILSAAGVCHRISIEIPLSARKNEIRAIITKLSDEVQKLCRTVFED